MVTPTFNCTIEKGKPVLYNPGKFKMYCVFLEGKDCELILRRKQKKKSTKQNKYYRGCVVPLIAQTMGYRDTSTEHEKVHGILLDKFFRETDDKGNTYIRSTKLDNWKTTEWEDKMGEIRQWASEFLDTFIPKPNEVDFD